MTVTRQDFITKLGYVIAGKRLPSYSADTLSQPNLCAQFVRQTEEDILGISPGHWHVAAVAVDVARKNNRSTRWAVDYEVAGIDLKLNKPLSDIRIGDVAYWEYIQYGHTAICVGEINGVIHFLENTNAKNRRGGRRVYTSPSSLGPRPIWLTPITAMGTPRTVIAPTPELLRPQQVVTPAPVKVTMETIMQQYSGHRLFIIQDNGTEAYVGDIVKASELGNGKIYIKTAQPKKQ